MNTEKLIAKGVEKKFDGQQLWFSVESLNEHYKGVKYHDSDLDDAGFIKASDIFGDDIQEIEVKPIEVDETPNLSVDADFPTYEKDNSDLEVLEPEIESEATAETSEENIEVESVEKIEEIIPAKVVKTKADKK